MSPKNVRMTPAVKRIAALAALVVMGSVLMVLGGRAPDAAPLAAATQTQDARALQWADLLPTGAYAFRPLDAASDFPDIASSPTRATEGGHLNGAAVNKSGLSLPDPNAARPDLAGVTVALAGYMTPLMVENGKTKSFLLVPYVGACIHVPAPPPNQVVLVEAPEPIEVLPMWQPFQAVGKMYVETIDTGLAPVGYTMELDRIEPYRKEQGELEGTRSANDGD